MLQRAMSVDAAAGPGYDRTFINRLLAENFQVGLAGSSPGGWQGGEFRPVAGAVGSSGHQDWQDQFYKSPL